MNMYNLVVSLVSFTWREAGHGGEEVVVDDGPVLPGLLPADGRRGRRRDEELLRQRRRVQVRLLVRARGQHLQKKDGRRDRNIS